MTRRVKWSLGCLLALLVILIGFWLLVPKLVLREVNSRPGISAEGAEVSLGPRCATLTNVGVHKEWVRGSVPRVEVCHSKRVRFFGGELTIDLDKKPKGEGQASSGYAITGEGLTLHVVKGGKTLVLRQATLHEDKLCSPVGEVQVDQGRAEVFSLCVDRKGTQATFGRAIVTVAEPVRGHEIKPITMEGVSVDFTKKEASLQAVSSPQFDLHAEGISVVFDLTTEPKPFFRATVDSIRVFEPRLHKGPLTFKDWVIEPNSQTGEWFTLTKKGLDPRISYGNIVVDLGPFSKMLQGQGDCQKWYDALPEELKVPALSEVRFERSFTAFVHLEPVELNWILNCKAAKPMPEAFRKLLGKFNYVAYDSKGKEFVRETGPGTESWVPFAEISPHMVTAVMTTEDPGFFDHQGFIKSAIARSLADDLKAGKPLRGGSTITMQLAKNLFLKRSKTIGRKIQEAFLTIALESYFTKQQLMELYLNVVEFGPDLYGIGPGARELLGTNPENLNLSDSLYLALRLPSPTKAGPLDDRRKTVIRGLLNRMASTGKVSEELAAAEAAMLENH